MGHSDSRYHFGGLGYMEKFKYIKLLTKNLYVKYTTAITSPTFKRLKFNQNVTEKMLVLK